MSEAEIAAEIPQEAIEAVVRRRWPQTWAIDATDADREEIAELLQAAYPSIRSQAIGEMRERLVSDEAVEAGLVAWDKAPFSPLPELARVIIEAALDAAQRGESDG